MEHLKEWQTDPINTHTVAQLAGTAAEIEKLDSGKIRYGRTHTVLERKELLSKGLPCVLVTTFSDAVVTDEMADQLPKNVVRWFSTNVMTSNPRVEAFPIGLRHSREILGIMTEVSNAPLSDWVKPLYVSFTRHQSMEWAYERVRLFEKFSKLSWVSAREAVPERQFFQDFTEHEFVLSPAGAGPDCHRTWEAMCLGTIPIVLKSRATAILDDLPALQVESWDEVVPRRLTMEYDRLRPRFTTPAMRKLALSFWRQRIEACLPV